MVVRARETDETAAAAGDEPERTCIVTRAKGTPETLIRFVAGPDDSIVPDLACRLPGRGVWVTCDRVKVAEAAKTNAFARSLKRKISVPDDLAGLVDSLLVRRAMDALSLANKAGLVVPGFTKAEIMIAKGEGYALAHAVDAAADGAGKLDRRLLAIQVEMDRGNELRVVRDLTAEELSLAMGRPHVVHAALRKGGAADNFLRAAGRLRLYRASGEIEAARPSNGSSDTGRV
ncbi:MAG: RNA-binding protein [Hyphomicrobiaceae bacterium]